MKTRTFKNRWCLRILAGVVALCSVPKIGLADMIGGASTASVTANAVCPANGGVCNATVTTALGVRVPYNMTISNLYAFQSVLPASGSTCTFTIRRSAGCTAAYQSTGLTCSLNSSTKTCQENVLSATVPAGDCLQLLFVESGTCSGFINWGFRDQLI